MPRLCCLNTISATLSRYILPVSLQQYKAPDSKDFELVHGLLLVSYPSIESFYLNSNNSFEKIPTNDFGTTKKVETVNQKFSEYMKTIKDFYGEITIKTLKENYDDSFEISFYTDKIDDTIIKTLEKYKDYEVYDACCEQYCSLPPIDRRVIILDNRKTKPW